MMTWNADILKLAQEGEFHLELCIGHTTVATVWSDTFFSLKKLQTWLFH